MGAVREVAAQIYSFERELAQGMHLNHDTATGTIHMHPDTRAALLTDPDVQLVLAPDYAANVDKIMGWTIVQETDITPGTVILRLEREANL